MIKVAKSIKPSARGELEITDVNKVYLDEGQLNVTLLDSDTNWFDTGTAESLSEASDYVRTHQKRTEQLLGSPEANAYRAGFISRDQLLSLAEPLKKSSYGKSLIQLATEGW